ncbi:hypothetical protein FVE67_01095 [Thermosulfurimonas marina]|uniref:Uncharacterized protein n=1 Tax=Thermosulfurimonas marina TaxID=2047767 RepID=A0A6H1WQK1_9BACT|nr:hypothetical protein [Thermosulfurimonas marina]QJA05471.1 hypothetical protein FVE67_01095 [Thermosulfurimonas marina]
MRCPKCRFITFEGRKSCPRCGEDLSALSETLGPFYEPRLPEDLILKDTILPPPSFIGTPEMPPPPGFEPEALETAPSLKTEEASSPESLPAPGKDEFFKELEEALEEETKGEGP